MNKIEKVKIVQGMINQFKNNIISSGCCSAYECTTGQWPHIDYDPEGFNLILEIEQFGVIEGILIRPNVMNGAYYQFIEHVPNASIAVRFRIILLEKFLNHLYKAA